MLSLVSARHCMSRTTHHPSGTPYLALAITMVVGASLFASHCGTHGTRSKLQHHPQQRRSGISGQSQELPNANVPALGPR